MINEYPNDVLNKILQITLKSQVFAYFSINEQGTLISQGGDVHSLGLPIWSLQDNVIDDLLFVSGFIPMVTEYEWISSLNISGNKVVDVHLFRDNELIRIVLVDKTKDLEWQICARQKANELKLLQHEKEMQKENSKNSSQSNRFELFEALNMMALKQNDEGAFDLLKPVPAEFYEIYPEVLKTSMSLHPELKFTFIENFLIDAKQLWEENINHQRIFSGPWVEQLEDKKDVVLEARAINWDNNKLLFIEIVSHCYQQNQDILQIGRESVLHKHELEREVRRQTADIRYLVTHDTLTKLPNRYSLYQHLNDTVKVATRNQQKFALFFMDLDEFKAVNDSLGHNIGDQLLIVIGERLLKVLREIDFAARFGGDEFCILLEDIADVYDAAQVAERCLEVISEPVTINGYELQPRVSIGITIFPDDGQNPEQLLSAADVAMYAAKRAGKQQYSFYTPEMTQLTSKRMSLEADLRHAVKNGGFELYYQPQISLITGKMIAVEALIRWPHSERGMVLPNEFINIAEKIGLISEMGDWVLRTACQQAIQWQQSGLEPFRIAVNISGTHFQEGQIVKSIKALLDKTQLDPALLELEITEDVVQTTETNIKTFTRLKELGLTIAIDDFGTGYSSLSSLKYLPIDCLKIDRMFIMDAPTNQFDSVIITTMLAMGKALNLSVLAEGVETAEQERYLQEIGCDKVQGFYYSKPVRAEQIPQLSVKTFI